ncbi:MAG TPA: transcription termination/antitermination protein NusA [Nitrospinae bacterium]|nr:transcription termination/antitermination protein NusA [Nitrospinota bacterium]
MGLDLINIINQIEKEKGIDRGKLIEAVKAAVISAFKKRLNFAENLEVIINEKTGGIELFAGKKVVEKVSEAENEILLKDAVKIKEDAKLDDMVMIPCSVGDLGRIAAQAAKQVILQKVRDAEKETVFDGYRDKKGNIISATVTREDRGDIIVDIGKTEGIIYKREQSFRENFKRGDRIMAYVIDVKKNTRGPQIILSRTHPGLIIKLFEMEVPEIAEGIVEIKGAARDPSGRSKVSVFSNKKDVDAVGACVGMRGIRVQSIVQELRGEKIDIIEWSDDPAIYVKNALSPAKVSSVNVNATDKYVKVIVADDQLSLAIGRKGQNVKLAVKLLHWKIDIKSESEYKKELEEGKIMTEEREATVEKEDSAVDRKEEGNNE